MDLGLNNKRELVTGASRGIGAAIVQGFLKKNAKTCIVSRGSEQHYQTKSLLVEEFGESRVIADECDCTDPTALAALKERVQERWLEDSFFL